MPEWRNDRDGNTGMPMNGGLSWNIETRYDENEISETSNS
jgi:hypothetical protein